MRCLITEIKAARLYVFWSQAKLNINFTFHIDRLPDDEVAPFEETPLDTDVHALPIPGTGGAYYNSNNAASDSAYYIPAPPPLPDNNDNLGLTPPPPLPFL